MKKWVAVIMAISAQSAYAERIANTPSGLPDAVFLMSMTDTVGNITSKCMDHGWSVLSSSGSQVVCEIPMGATQSFLAQALIGNSYSTVPKRFMRITVGQLGERKSRAQASGWIETQMAFGQQRQEALQSDAAFNSLQAFLISAGGEFPSGTAFRDWPWIGADLNDTPVGLGVRGVVAGGPGELAGLRQGDFIVAVGRNKVKNSDEYFKRVSKLTAAPFEISILREGELIKLTVEHRHRDPIP